MAHSPLRGNALAAILRGLGKTGYNTAMGIAGFAGADAAVDRLRQNRDQMLEFYGEPSTLALKVLEGGAGFVGEGATFLAGAAPIKAAMKLPAAASFAGRAANNFATGAPLDFLMGGGRATAEGATREEAAVAGAKEAAVGLVAGQLLEEAVQLVQRAPAEVAPLLQQNIQAAARYSQQLQRQLNPTQAMPAPSALAPTTAVAMPVGRPQAGAPAAPAAPVDAPLEAMRDYLTTSKVRRSTSVDNPQQPGEPDDLLTMKHGTPFAYDDFKHIDDVNEDSNLYGPGYYHTEADDVAAKVGKNRYDSSKWHVDGYIAKDAPPENPVMELEETITRRKKLVERAEEQFQAALKAAEDFRQHHLKKGYIIEDVVNPETGEVSWMARKEKGGVTQWDDTIAKGFSELVDEIDESSRQLAAFSNGLRIAEQDLDRLEMEKVDLQRQFDEDSKAAAHWHKEIKTRVKEALKGVKLDDFDPDGHADFNYVSDFRRAIQLEVGDEWMKLMNGNPDWSWQEAREELYKILEKKRPELLAAVKLDDSDELRNLTDKMFSADMGAQEAKEILDSYDSPGPAYNVRPARLAISNPFDIDKEFEVKDLLDLKTKMIKAIRMEPPGMTPPNAEDQIHDGISSLIGTAAMGTRKVRGQDVYDTIVRLVGGKRGANQALQRLGFDGITHIGGGRWGNPGARGNKHRIWIAFRREQIRNAFGDPSKARSVGGPDPSYVNTYKDQ